MGLWCRMGPPVDSVQLPNRKVAEFYGFMVDITIVNGGFNGL